MPRPDSCAPKPRDWVDPSSVLSFPQRVCQKASWLYKTFVLENIEFLQEYKQLYKFTKTTCYNRCLKSAKDFSNLDNSLVWEARNFCTMACLFPELDGMEDCYTKCYVACKQGKGEDVGLSASVSEYIGKYGDNPRKARECLDMCSQGCLFRIDEDALKRKK